MRATDPSPRIVVPPMALRSRKERAERLDDRLQFARELIDHQAETVATVLDHDETFANGLLAGHVEHVAQADERQRFAAQAHQIAVDVGGHEVGRTP